MEKTEPLKITAFKCPNCGAATSPDSASCPYCKASLATRICRACFHAVAIGMKHCPQCGAAVIDAPSGQETAINCLRCDSVLETHSVDRYFIHVCRQCGGIWLNKKTFHDICNQMEMQKVMDYSFPEPPVRAEEKPQKTYLPCPDCGKLMNHKAFAHGSGVVIDWCRHHGVWLDQNELSKIAEFIKQDGMRRHQEREASELRTQKRMQIQQQMSSYGTQEADRKEADRLAPPYSTELAKLREKIMENPTVDSLKQIFKYLFVCLLSISMLSLMGACSKSSKDSIVQESTQQQTSSREPQAIPDKESIQTGIDQPSDLPQQRPLRTQQPNALTGEPSPSPEAKSDPSIINGMEQNEAAVIATLLNIGIAQSMYLADRREYGTLDQLTDREQYLMGWRPSSAGINGYHYTEDLSAPPRSYKITAHPVTPDRTGRYAYSIEVDKLEKNQSVYSVRRNPIVRYVQGPPGVKPGDYVRNTLPTDSAEHRETAAMTALTAYANAQTSYIYDHNAQASYSHDHKKTFVTLEELVNGKYLDERYLSPDGFNGYYFTENKTSLPQSFELIAHPTASKPAGRYTYSIMDDRVIRYVKGPSGVKPGDYVRNTLLAYDSAENREVTAITALRNYGSAQSQYSATHQQRYGTLEELVNGKYLDERYLSPDGFNGYYFTESKTPQSYSFELVAHPTASKPAGRYTYSIGTDGVIRYVEGPPGVKPGRYVD